MAEIMQNSGKIEAWDIHEHRTKLVKNAANRLKINIIETKVNDASKENNQYLEKFDKILLDVPCLGIGVLKRKPDIKWQKNVENIKEISKVQSQILETCSKYLKTGGSLVYSTCSILKGENDKVVEKFLKNNSKFELKKIELDEKKGENYFEKYLKNKEYLQVYQNEKTDGFFICKLVKIR